MTLLYIMADRTKTKYAKLKFIKSELSSPTGNGAFTIFINTEKKILYKKIKQNKNIFGNFNVDVYKKNIYGIMSNSKLCEYVFEPEKVYIEEDGSYYCSYIENGVRLYDIDSNYHIEDAMFDNLINSIIDIRNKLKECVKTEKLCGDWALHNLIYCVDTNKIYNVDFEGFFTYPLINNNGNCDIKYIDKRFDKLLETIYSMK